MSAANVLVLSKAGPPKAVPSRWFYPAAGLQHTAQSGTLKSDKNILQKKNINVGGIPNSKKHLWSGY